jgi:hypothetical protein
LILLVEEWLAAYCYHLTETYSEKGKTGLLECATSSDSRGLGDGHSQAVLSFEDIWYTSEREV